MVVARTELVREHRYFEQASLCLVFLSRLLDSGPSCMGSQILFLVMCSCCTVAQAACSQAAQLCCPLHPSGWLSKQLHWMLGCCECCHD